MRIATWNLRRVTDRAKRADEIKCNIRKIKASVWILTETHENISPGEDFKGIFSSEPERGGQRGEKWVAIWFRYSEFKAIPSSDCRTAIALINTPDGERLLIYGTVLPWLTDQSRAPLKGASAFCNALEFHTRELNKLRKEQAVNRLVVAGDFNQGLSAQRCYGSKTGKNCLEKFLNDTGLRCVTSDKYDPVLALTGGKRSNIDHICIDQQWAAQEFTTQAWPARDKVEIRKGQISDHFGVCVAL